MSDQQKVRAFLREMLKGGRLVLQKEIEAVSRLNGFSDKQLRLAKEKLCVEASKEAGKPDGGWIWCLPKQETR